MSPGATTYEAPINRDSSDQPTLADWSEGGKKLKTYLFGLQCLLKCVYCNDVHPRLIRGQEASPAGVSYRSYQGTSLELERARTIIAKGENLRDDN